MRTKLRPITADLHQSQNRLSSSAGELNTAVELGAGDVTGNILRPASARQDANGAHWRMTIMK